MGWFWAILAGCVGAVVGLAIGPRLRSRGDQRRNPTIQPLLTAHFRPLSMSDIHISERKFPFRVRADLQRAMDRLFDEGTCISHFYGIQKDFNFEGITFSNLLAEGHSPGYAVPSQYEDVDIGEAQPLRCLKNGLWLLQRGEMKYAVLLSPVATFQGVSGVQFQIATPSTQEGFTLTEQFFKHLEESVLKSESYRGKVLSLEISQHSYTGEATGINVQRLHAVAKEQVILPQKTLGLLERNVIQFVAQREKLAKYGQPTKKGLLFYGPPGTGKTHTLHYLAGALQGHTMLLISAEQVALLAEYMTLARLLQPSIVVLEDADLIARERTQMDSPCEEVLLNKLLNEMDGLKEQADILFILTTNRPESLEAALTSRPGRIDQAIEFPLPDEEGREKLIRLYSQGIELSEETIQAIVKRTERVSCHN